MFFLFRNYQGAAGAELVGPSLMKKARRWWGMGVAEEHMRWGPVVRPAAPAVFCMGRITDEEEEGLGDVGSSSNRLKWSRDSWEMHS